MSIRKNLVALLPTLLLFLTVNNQSAIAQCGDLYIAGVIDGPLSGGNPKGVLFCASANIADLSIYGFGSANNGGGTDGEEFTFPTGTLNAGDCFWVANESTEFNNWFGFTPCFTDSGAGISGDDAIELFCGGNVVDLFGDINMDGSGLCWDHMDGWAANNMSMQNGGAFDCNDYAFSGINALDGETSNATAINPFPISTQTCPVQMLDCAITNVTVMQDGTCSGDDASYEICADVTGGSGNYDLVDVDNANAIVSSLTGQMDGTICFMVTLTGPTTAAALNVDVVDNMDATCISGSPVAVTIPACPITTCSITNVTVMADGSCSGNDATYTICADVAAGSGNYDLVDTGNGNAVLAALSAQPDGNICFTVTLTGPTTASTISVDVLDNGDPSCIGGSPTTVTIPVCPIVSSSDVFISELSYDPCGDQGSDGDCEYIILTNPSASAVDLTGFTITNAVTFTFPAGTMIPAGGTLSIGSSTNCTGLAAFDLASLGGSLGNGGETVDLLDPNENIVYSVTYDPGDGADGNCMALCYDQSGTVSECPSSLDTGGMCPDLSAPAPPVIITESTCPSGGTVPTGGLIELPATDCPTGSTLEFSEDGMNWSQTLTIMYDQDGPPQTISTRCICDSDPTMISQISGISTNPGSCAGCAASISTFPANGN